MLTYKEINGLPDVWSRLARADEPVCIYGTGDAAERILDIFELRGIECAGIFASDGFVRDREFRGHKVCSLSELEAKLGKFTAVSAFGSSLPDVMSAIDSLSERHTLLMPDLPVAGSEMFSKKGLLERYEQYVRVRERFADEQSREVLDAVLRYKLTGELSGLCRVFTDPTADFKRLIAPREDDIYADLGAYNGDTCELFAELCPDYLGIYAFEPDKRSFRKLVKRLESFDNVIAVNACAWSHDGNIGFSQSAGRQSQISAGGEVTAARSLDSVLCGGECSVIKFDVEGAESRALDGSAETISRYRPRLAVSAYHRPYDILDLAEQILSIRGDYTLYLRQPPYYPAWDTMIYAV
ncbi:MAG: FkbM family methyltransferase [Ruminococcus sp.]|nr:FkbM family methyltransferase [Ruminococcus sp.]